MILTAHQSVYLPWLGLFHKIALAEMFCLFDIVQYQKRDYNNRNKIKTPNGEIWLTVPVESKQHFGKILEARDIKVHLLLSICEAVECSLDDLYRIRCGELNANLNDRNQ